MSDYYDIQWQPAIYNGTVYRSTLESRWAQIMTKLGVVFKYEPKLYFIPELEHTPEEWYTPDFGLLSCPVSIVEIKPKYPPSNAIVKCASISKKMLVTTAIIYGSCWPYHFDIMLFQRGEEVQIPRSIFDRFKYRLPKVMLSRVVGLKAIFGKRDYRSIL